MSVPLGAPGAGLGSGPCTVEAPAPLRISIVGGSGYVGGELLRLLLGHPRVKVQQVTSRRLAGRFVHQTHPNLRRRTALQFVPPEALDPCDLIFLALPHGESSHLLDGFLALAPHVIDLSGDHRLKSAGDYPVWYGWEHPAPDRLAWGVYGLPELHRREIRGAHLVSGTGCLAAAAIIGLYPLFRNGLVQPDPVVIEGKFGSSAGGAEPSPASHHPERASVIRTYEPVGHRHTAEIAQELRLAGCPVAAAGDGCAEALKIHLTATAVDTVRGVQCCCHVFLRDAGTTERDIWRIYREAYADEPFVRLVKERHGAHRYPDPKVLSGSNYCDVGFACDPHSSRLVVISALDNLMKGAAGNGVQAMNVLFGWPEEEGLGFPGLHPC